MKKIKIILLAFALISPSLQAGGSYCPPACSPGSVGGGNCGNTGYIFAYGGISFLDSLNAELHGETFSHDIDSGYIIGGGVGLRSCFLGGSRFEIEGLLKENDVQPWGGPLDGATAQIQTSAILFNVIKEIPIGCVTGHIGGGFGWSTNDLHYQSGGASASDSHSQLAYQFVAGVDYAVSDCISLFAQYKLLRSGDGDYDITGSTLWLDEHWSNNVVFGARVGF